MKNNVKHKILLLSITLLITQVSAAEVKVIPSNDTVAPGEIFNLNVSIDPSGTAIAGVQMEIEFNNSMLDINNIIEGDIFKNEGTGTFFNRDITNNSTISLIKIYSAILGKYNVSAPGTFIMINFTATGSQGRAGINLSNVKIVNPEGNYVPADIINGSLNISGISPDIPRHINGTVIDSFTKAGIEGVTVFTNTGTTTITDGSGFYSLAVTAGTYDITVTFDPEYYPNSTTVLTEFSDIVVQDIELVKKPTGTITGSVIIA